MLEHDPSRDTAPIPDDFTGRYLAYTSGQESPSIFHTWVAASIVGNVAARNVFLDMSYFKIYPNHYTILVAGSGACRKGVALEIGIGLLRDAIGDDPERLILSEKITPEALCKTLGKSFTKGEGRNEQRFSRPTILYSDELGVFMSQAAQNAGMVDLLTRLYGCPKLFEYVTKTSGTDIINNVCLSILGATTPLWIQGNVTPAVFGEGFAGRTMWVFADKPERRVPRPIITSRELEIKRLLVKQLMEIAQIKGEFKFTSSGGNLFDDWYNTREAGSDLSKLSGFHEREPVHVLKLAMVYALCANSGLELYPEHIQAAIDWVAHTRSLMPNALAGADVDPEMKNTIKVLLYLRKREGWIMRMELSRAVKLPANILNDSISNLIDNGSIEVKQHKSSGAMIYRAISEEELSAGYE